MLLDPETWDLVQHIDSVLAAVGDGEFEARINPELMQSVIEITTPVCRTPGRGRHAPAPAPPLRRRGRRAARAAGSPPPGRIPSASSSGSGSPPRTATGSSSTSCSTSPGAS